MLMIVPLLTAGMSMGFIQNSYAATIDPEEIILKMEPGETITVPKTITFEGQPTSLLPSFNQGCTVPGSFEIANFAFSPPNMFIFDEIFGVPENAPPGEFHCVITWLLISVVPGPDPVCNLPAIQIDNICIPSWTCDSIPIGPIFQPCPVEEEFSLTQTISITVTGLAKINVLKFNDINANGVQDPDEEGIQGWGITLECADEPLRGGSTGGNGMLLFEEIIVPDTCTVSEEERPEWTPTTPTSVTFELNPEDEPTVVFGNAPPVFLVIDEDSIDNGIAPTFFEGDDVNEDDAEVGVRTQLPFFADNVGEMITLHTGEVGDEGWFALTKIPADWEAGGVPGLTNFLLPGPGLGDESDELGPEDLLDKIPDVTPLRFTGLNDLVGRTVCAVVYDSDISINYDPLDGSLKGANLGTVAFEVNSVTAVAGTDDFSDSSLPKVEITILDAKNIDGDGACEGPLALFTDAPAPESSSEPFDVEPPTNGVG